MTDETTLLNEMNAAILAYEAGLRKHLLVAGIDNITMNELMLLEHVSDSPKSMVQIAALRTVSKQAVQSQTQSLIKRGFVNVAPDPSDARVRLVSLSPLGRQSVDAFRTAQSDVQARVQAKLGTERLKNFRNILGQIVGSIS
jgi:DNA-binding MarR family transcriptional regulator